MIGLIARFFLLLSAEPFGALTDCFFVTLTLEEGPGLDEEEDSTTISDLEEGVELLLFDLDFFFPLFFLPFSAPGKSLSFFSLDLAADFTFCSIFYNMIQLSICT